jgi:hypothetical protein
MRQSQKVHPVSDEAHGGAFHGCRVGVQALAAKCQLTFVETFLPHSKLTVVDSTTVNQPGS